MTHYRLSGCAAATDRAANQVIGMSVLQLYIAVVLCVVRCFWSS
eukprot:SAG31_NODE_20443_length_574_cov_1.124211_1_plen_43_part_10